MSKSKALTSILVVDDHRLVRDMLSAGLEAALPGVRVDTAKDLTDALEHIERRPNTDVILLDYNLPDVHGTTVISRVRGAARQPKIIVLSAYVRKSMLAEIEIAGADGAVSKDIGIHELRSRILDVFGGRKHFAAPEAEGVGADFAEKYQLSRRELEAWRHLAEGHRNAVIATRMGISESTVKVHLHNVFRKIGVHSRVEAYEFWRKIHA